MIDANEMKLQMFPYIKHNYFISILSQHVAQSVIVFVHLTVALKTLN